MASLYQSLARTAAQTTGHWPALFATPLPAQTDKGLWKEAEDKTNPALFVPQQVSGVEAHSLVEHNKTVWVLKRRETNTYIRLSPEDYVIWSLIDGQRTSLKIALAYMKQYKSLALPRVISLVDLLWQMGFLDNGAFDQVYAPLRQKLGQRGLQAGLGWVMQTFLSRQFALKGFDVWITRLYNAGVSLLFNPVLLILFLLIALLGLGRFILLGDFALVFPDSIADLLLFLASTIVALFLHECGHAFTVKRFGRDVNRGGLLIMFGMPGAFVDTTDMWLAPKYARLAVTAAGPAVNLVLGGAATLLGLVFPSAAGALHLFAIFNYILIVTNLTPFIKLDGYYLLMDALEIANLRERALGFVSHGLWQTLKQGWAQGHWLPRFNREQKIFVLFGGISSLYTFYLVYFSTLFLPDRFLGVVTQLSTINLRTLAGLGVLLTVVFTLVFGVAQLAFAASRVRGLLKQLEEAVIHLPAWQSVTLLFVIAGVLSLIPNFLVTQHSLNTAHTWAVILSVVAPLLTFGLSALLICGMFGSPWRGWYGALAVVGLGFTLAACLEAGGWLGSMWLLLIRVAVTVYALAALLRILRFWSLTLRGSIAGAWALVWLGLMLALLPLAELNRLGSLLLLAGIFLAWHITHSRLAAPIRPADIAAEAETDVSKEGANLSRAFSWLMSATCTQAVALMGKKRFVPLARTFNRDMASRNWPMWFTAPNHFADFTLGSAKERGRVYRTALIVWLAEFATSSNVRLADRALTEAYLQLPPRLRRLAATKILSGFAHDGSMPWDVDSRGGDRLRLRMAFHHLVEWPLKTCQKIYGLAFTNRIVSDFNRTAALVEWGFSIGETGRIVETGAQDQNMLALSDSFYAALLSLLGQLAFYAGSAFVENSLLQAYDTLPWQLREVAEPAFLRALPWARKLQFGKALSLSDALRQVPAFSGLTNEMLDELASHAKRQQLDANKVIYKAGQRLAWGYVLLAGQANSKRQLNKVLDTGSLLAFDSVLQDTPTQDEVRTVTPVELIRIPAAHVRQALNDASLSPEAVLLSRIPMFRDLATAQLRQLADHLQPRDLMPNEIVVQHGEAGRELFIIGWGELQVSVPNGAGRERTIAHLGPGEFFGEMALLRNEPRSASVRALTDAQVFSLSAEDYARLMQEMPSLQNALSQVGSRRQLELRTA